MQLDLKALEPDLGNKNNLLDGVWLISCALKFSVKLKHIDSGRCGETQVSGKSLFCLQKYYLQTSSELSWDLIQVWDLDGPTLTLHWEEFI